MKAINKERSNVKVESSFKSDGKFISYDDMTS